MSTIAVVYLFGAFQGLVLVSVLASKNRREINAKTFLITFIALNVGYLFHQFAVYERFIERYPHLIGVYLPILFLLPPLFYLYIRFESSSTPWKRIYWVHFAPTLLALMVMTPYYLSTAQEKLMLLFNDFHTRSIYPFRGPLGMALLLSGAIYAGLAIKHARKNTSRNAPWIRSFSIGFSVLIVCLAISYYLMNAYIIPHRLTISSAIIIFSLFIHFIGYAALMEPTLLNSPAPPKRALNFGDAVIKKRLITILEDENIFTQAGFTLKDLSQLMSTNENYLSRYINQEFGCNFPHLLNSYRIEKAKYMINSPAYDHLNLLGIATAVGFANKNTFTRAFKRHTGQTPSGFKENSRSNEVQFMN